MGLHLQSRAIASGSGCVLVGEGVGGNFAMIGHVAKIEDLNITVELY